MPDFKERFTHYIQASNVAGSGKAVSYIRALDLLCEMLEKKSFGFDDCKNVWEVDSVERLHELYLLVLEETRKKDASEWNIPGIPKSYLQNGYCSAALNNYQSFLVENNYEQNLLDFFDAYEGEENKLPENLELDISNTELLIEGLDKKQGLEVIRSVRVRSNQNVFRKIILKIYNDTCCITGLNIPEINIASHIIPWAEDETIRLDPTNGLCLSATYDAAFDRNMISLDDDYRMILSKNIKDYYTSDSVNEYFIKKEGYKITLPSSYHPNKRYLENHRGSGVF